MWKTTQHHEDTLGFFSLTSLQGNMWENKTGNFRVNEVLHSVRSKNHVLFLLNRQLLEIRACYNLYIPNS
jgi:hypothetical protein